MAVHALWDEATQLLKPLTKFLALSTSCIFIYILVIVVYRLFLHPLSRVPGPRCAALSNVWLAYHARNGLVAKLGTSLHGAYGSAVRVGPSEVWFNSVEAFKAIYGSGSGYEKSDFYLATALPKPQLDWRLRPRPADTLDLLSERDMDRYRLQRRLIGPVYRASNVIKLEPAIDTVLAQAVKAIEKLDGAEVDLTEWMHIIAVECLGGAVLSWSPGMLRDGTDRGSCAQSYLGWRRKSVFGLFPAWVKLETCHGSLGRLFSTVWRLTYRAPASFRTFFPDVGRRVGRRIRTATKAQPSSDDRNDLMADLIRLHLDKPQFSTTYLRKMAVTNFGAGHETMASTLTSLIAMIGLHDDVHLELAAEVRSSSNASTYAVASKLPYMQAVIKEARRLHPVIGMALPRRVPAHGLRLHGHYFPPGTTVGCNPWALHRNPDVAGAEPDVFDPGRWADADNARSMELYSLGWGGGARTCPGRHLAELVVSKVVPALLQHFDVNVTVPSEDQMPSYFLSAMTGVKTQFLPKGTRDGKTA